MINKNIILSVVTFLLTLSCGRVYYSYNIYKTEVKQDNLIKDVSISSVFIYKHQRKQDNECNIYHNFGNPYKFSIGFKTKNKDYGKLTITNFRVSTGNKIIFTLDESIELQFIERSIKNNIYFNAAAEINNIIIDAKYDNVRVEFDIIENNSNKVISFDVIYQKSIKKFNRNKISDFLWGIT